MNIVMSKNKKKKNKIVDDITINVNKKDSHGLFSGRFRASTFETTKDKKSDKRRNLDYQDYED